MIVLYNPHSSAGRKPILPMSLLSLGALLEGEYDYVIVDGNLSPDPLPVLEATIQETKATILGVTVMPGPQLNQAVPLCRELKVRFPHLTIIWGGYFPTQHYESCLSADYVDYVVRGHGEVVFQNLLRLLTTGGDPTTLAGLAYRHPHTGAIVSNPMAPIPAPDTLPDFPYHRVNLERYIRKTFMGDRTLPHHSSYGCPFFCNFCAVVNMVKGRWIAQSAERAAHVAQTAVERWKINAIEFYDNNFFVHEARTAEFADRIKDLDLGWWGEARVDTMLHYSDQTWDLMRKSGLRMVFLGAESGSDETLKRMNKGGTATAQKTLDLVQKMAHYGVVPELSFVLGNPPDPAADVHDTLTFIRKVKRLNPAAEIILYLYTPVPLAGDLYDQARAEGFQFPQTLEEWIDPAWQEFSQRRSALMPWIKDPLRRRLHNFERVLNAYYPTTTDIKLTGFRRAVLRGMAAWRYHLNFYHFPLELRVLQKIMSYQRPETSSF